MKDWRWMGAAGERPFRELVMRVLVVPLRVPPVPWCMEKELLRKAMRGILPEEIRSRPKTALLFEPIDCFVKSNRWSPLPLAEPPSEIRTYVDWQRLGATLVTATGLTLW